MTSCTTLGTVPAASEQALLIEMRRSLFARPCVCASLWNKWLQSAGPKQAALRVGCYVTAHGSSWLSEGLSVPRLFTSSCWWCWHLSHESVSLIRQW